MVHIVFITWHDPSLKVSSSLYDYIKQEDYHRLEILKQSYDSLNSRFNSVNNLQTNAVYIMDDDIFIDLTDIKFTFNVWRSQMDGIVSYFPRLHTYGPTTKHATYKINPKVPYSIILTKSMFIRSEYLFAYTCVLDPKLHEYVDKELNCKELAFAMMVSGLSHAASTLVNINKPIGDFGLKKSISTNNKYMSVRGECISNFITRYWGKRAHLFNHTMQ